VTLLALAGVAAVAAAAEPSYGKTRVELLEEHIQAGDLEYVDSKTGKVVVATKEAVSHLRRELAPVFEADSEFTAEVADDGTVSSPAGGAVRDVHLVRTNLDGTRETTCVRTLDAAVAFLVGLDRVLEPEGADAAVVPADR
jgi:hypothetical protein